jgi:hypothetical protein
MAARKPKPVWRNRIVRFDPAVDPEQFLAHPLNYRTHPAAQREALRGSHETLGIVGIAIVNERTGHTLDGHARIEEAITARQPYPALYVDLEPEEEPLFLATFDPITLLAGRDDEMYAFLIEGLEVENAALAALIAGEPIPIEPLFSPTLPDEQPNLDERTPTMCPQCSFEWHTGPQGEVIPA